jgi:hypothetical protein
LSLDHDEAAQRQGSWSRGKKIWFSIMSETQLATIARLEQRLDTLKERL